MHIVKIILNYFFLVLLFYSYVFAQQYEVKLTQNAELVYDWQGCDEGESCYRLNHIVSKKFQYPIKIVMPVTEEEKYKFVLNYKLPHQAKASIYCFYKDENGTYIKDKPKNIYADKFELLQRDNFTKKEFIFEVPKRSKKLYISLRLEGEYPFSMYVGKNFEIKKIASTPKLLCLWDIEPNKHIFSAKFDLKYTDTKLCSQVDFILKSNHKTVYRKVDLSKTINIKLNDYFNDKEKVYIDAKCKTYRYKDSFINYNHISWKNQYGILDKDDLPPSPWEPLVWDDVSKTIYTWNHEIKFNNLLEITSIIVKNLNEQELFLNDKYPQFSLNNKKLANTIFQNDGIQLLYNSPNKIILGNHIETDNAEFDINATVEYDGFVQYRVNIIPKKSISSFTLSYALKDGNWFLRNNGSWKDYRLLKIPNKKLNYLEQFFPFLWYGNRHYGIYWMAEEIYPSINIKNRWLTYSKENGLKIDFLLSELKNNITLNFAIGITPSRPKNRKYDHLIFRTKNLSNFDLIWSTPDKFTYFGFPSKTDNFLIEKKDLKILSFYQTPTYCMDSMPEWNYFKNEWENTPSHLYDFTKTYHAKAQRVDITKNSWQDFYLKNLKNFLVQNPEFNSIYFDLMQLYRTKRGDKEIYPVFDMRKFFSRIYILQKQINKNAIFFLHSSPSVFTIAMPFADIAMSGEEFHQRMTHNRFYLEAVKSDILSMQFTADAGTKRMFLAQYGKVDDVKEDKYRASEAVGLSMLNNILLYTSYLDQNTVYGIQKYKEDFLQHHINTTFIPYWQENYSTNKNVLISAYIDKNKNDFFLIAVNISSKKEYFNLTISQTSKLTVYNPIEDKITSNNSLLEIEPYSMLILNIQN